MFFKYCHGYFIGIHLTGNGIVVGTFYVGSALYIFQSKKEFIIKSRQGIKRQNQRYCKPQPDKHSLFILFPEKEVESKPKTNYYIKSDQATSYGQYMQKNEKPT